MRTREAAERWVADSLREAAPAFARQAPGLGYASLADYENSLRSLVEHSLRPVDQYVGLDLEQAAQLAAESGDRLCVHRRTRTGHRASWRADRVHVTVGPDGTVVHAALDQEPWH